MFGKTKSLVGILIYFRAKGLRNHVLQTLHLENPKPGSKNQLTKVIGPVRRETEISNQDLSTLYPLLVLPLHRFLST